PRRDQPPSDQREGAPLSVVILPDRFSSARRSQGSGPRVGARTIRRAESARPPFDPRHAREGATMPQSFTGKKRIRKSFGRIPEAVQMPNLIEVQRSSYEQFLQREVRPADRG